MFLVFFTRHGLISSDSNRLSYTSAKTLESSGAQIKVSVQGSNIKHLVALKDPGEAHKTLSCWKATNGSARGQSQVLLK